MGPRNSMRGARGDSSGQQLRHSEIRDPEHRDEQDEVTEQVEKLDISGSASVLVSLCEEVQEPASAADHRCPSGERSISSAARSETMQFREFRTIRAGGSA